MKIKRPQRRKKTAVYYRVSTEGQDFQLQVNSIAPYIQDIPPEDIEFFQDFGVSANTVPLHQRPEIQRLLNWADEGRINHLYVYARDRMMREPYEWDEIRSRLFKSGVHVTYTGTSELPPQSDSVEGFLGYLTYLNGQLIRSKTQEAHRSHPSHLYGYKRHARNHYEIDEIQAENVKHLFDNFRFAVTFEDKVSVIRQYSKILKRSDARIFAMLDTPFYAGLKTFKDEYVRLTHAPVIIGPDTYLEVAEKLNLFRKELNEYQRQSPPHLVTPVCGLCGKPMHLNSSQLPDEEYVCGRHKLHVAARELDAQLQELVKERITKIDGEAIRRDTVAFLQHWFELRRREISKIETDIRKLSDEIVNTCVPGCESEKFQILDALKMKLEELLTEQQQAHEINTEIHNLVEIIQHQLSDEFEKDNQLRAASEVLIDTVRLYPTHAEVDFYWCQYLREGA